MLKLMNKYFIVQGSYWFAHKSRQIILNIFQYNIVYLYWTIFSTQNTQGAIQYNKKKNWVVLTMI